MPQIDTAESNVALRTSWWPRSRRPA